MNPNISKILDSKLKDEFISVSRKKNPIINSLSALSYDQKLSILQQYSLFPKNIVSFLVVATYSLSYHNWDNVVEELRQNITEELGKGDGSIAEYNLPHYTILRKVIYEGFGEDIADAIPQKPTSQFLDRIKKNLEDKRPEFVCGAVYALESSAVPELTLIKELVMSAANNREITLPKLLLAFFDYHIDSIEIGHRDRLMEMVSKHISGETGWELFEMGFDKVMEVMDEWWMGLNSEILCLKY